MKVRVRYFEKLECVMCELLDYVERYPEPMTEPLIDKQIQRAHFRRHHGGLEP